MLFLIFLIIILLIIYYLWNIECWRYINFKSIEDIKYYDKNYSKLPRINSKRKVVVSMTTIPSRINKLKPTLASILDSNYKVDKIYLNISKYSLKGEKYIIPKWLQKMKNVSINWIKRDLGPATKLIPILKKEKKTIIIIIDDDVIYGSKLIENYIDVFYKKKCALTIFGNNIKNGKLENEFPSFLQYREGYYVDTLKGHDSFLVTPEMFPVEVFNYKKAPKECFWVDDIWFSGWLRYNKVKIYSLGFNRQNIPITNSNHLNTPSLSEGKNLNDKNNEKAISFFQKKYDIFNN
jgi:hypothetical protein